VTATGPSENTALRCENRGSCERLFSLQPAVRVGAATCREGGDMAAGDSELVLEDEPVEPMFSFLNNWSDRELTGKGRGPTTYETGCLWLCSDFK